MLVKLDENIKLVDYLKNNCLLIDHLSSKPDEPETVDSYSLPVDWFKMSSSGELFTMSEFDLPNEVRDGFDYVKTIPNSFDINDPYDKDTKYKYE